MIDRLQLSPKTSIIANSNTIPDSWLKIKIETEYLDPQQISQPEINAVALGTSLASLSANPSLEIPKFPNPRGLNTKQAVFQDMIKTLLVQPHLFGQKNHGIKISTFVERIESTSTGTSVLTLRFAPPSKQTIGQGVHDGQHTLYAFIAARLKGASLKAARARLLLLNGYLPTEAEGDNTIAWQANYRHDNRTKYNAQGRFDTLKGWIPPHWTVGYYQNQPDVSDSPRCSVDHIMQLLAVIDPTKYNWLNPKMYRHPIIYARNLGAHYEQICNSASALAHLVEDAVSIEQAIYKCVALDYHKTHQKLPGFLFPETGSEHLFSGKVILPNRAIWQMQAPRGVVFPLVSAFRLLLCCDRSTGTIDWTIDFDKHRDSLVKILWNRTRVALLEKVEQGIGQNASGILLTDVEYWHSLCAEAHKFVHAKLRLV